MDLPNVERGDWLGILHQIFNVLDGFFMVGHLKMLAQGFSANGQSGFKDQACFLECDRAPLDRI